jgi:hypothetical protein
MIMRLQPHVWGFYRFGLKLESGQFTWRAARTFELRLLTGGLPVRLPETQIPFRCFAICHDYAKTRRGKSDQ